MSKHVLYEEPLQVLKERASERINTARWTGHWGEIDQSIIRKYGDIPKHLQDGFNKMFEKLKGENAFTYQKFDAALAALVKNAILTHTPGLGKTRISLLVSKALNKPTIVIALPRLVRSVWKNEAIEIGIEDCVILERPKQSHLLFLKRAEGKPEDYSGIKGLGIIGLSKIKRNNDTTADVFSKARIKVVSYNMLIPPPFKLDHVVCPKCGRVHNNNTCKGIYIEVRNIELKPSDDQFIMGVSEKYRRKELDINEVDDQIKKRFGKDVNYSVNICNTPAKGAHCPHCRKKGIISVLGNKNNKGYHCSICGYSARTWVPPLSRRIKKWAKMVVIDESQAVKDSSSLRSKYSLSIMPEYRYMTSGTPATADLINDLYCQMRWITGLRQRGGGQNIMFPYKSAKDFSCEMIRCSRNDMVKHVQKLLDPFQIRRELDDYGVSFDVDLPPVREKRLSIPMSDEEYENYREASDNVIAWLKKNNENASELDLFSQMWILRRAACVPWVDNPNIRKSTKVDALKLEVNHYLSQGRKVLIGTEMIDMLDAIVDAIPGAARIDGDVNIKEADQIISLFQDMCPACNLGLVEEFGKLICPLCEKTYETPKVLAVSRMAVKEGVTLNRASAVILVNPSWTYADHYQFWKRAHRIGCSYEYLDVIYMEAADTIETRMYDTVEERKEVILEAINRKQGETTEKINIRNFIHDLLVTAIGRPVKRNL